MSVKLIYVLSLVHKLFREFYIHIHVKPITFPLNLVLPDFSWKASDLGRKYAQCFQKES